MIDASFSHQRTQEDRAVALARRRLIIPLGAALVLIGGVTAWALGGGKVDAPSPNVAIAPATATSNRASDELLETAKGLQVTQQQAVDQLQVVQDQLAAQKAETKKLSEQMAAVTEKLDALQQSVASMPAPPVAVPVSPPKSRHQ
jgi:septal ring factor EnvC (AmiA/AmiB activator)